MIVDNNSHDTLAYSIVIHFLCWLLGYLRQNIPGFPHNSIYWLKDGQPLRFSARVRQMSESRLQIVSVSREDRGMYQCIVKNDWEMSQGSAELQLGGRSKHVNSVIYLDKLCVILLLGFSFAEVYPHLAYKFIEQTIQPGPPVSLKCSASGNPTPQISWMLDGFPLPHTER